MKLLLLLALAVVAKADMSEAPSAARPWLVIAALVNLALLGVNIYYGLKQRRIKKAAIAGAAGQQEISTEVPEHVAQLFTAANVSNAQVLYVGKPLYATTTTSLLVMGTVGHGLSAILLLAVPLEFMYVVIAYPFLIGLMGTIFLWRAVNNLEKTVYILTTDSAYVFAIRKCSCQCDNGVTLVNKWNLALVQPTLSAVDVHGIGNIALEGRPSGHASQAHAETLGALGFMTVAQAPMLQERILTWARAAAVQQGLQPQSQQGQVAVPIGQQPMFDPYTGRPLQQIPQGARFDPFTGQPLHQQQQENSTLVQPQAPEEGVSHVPPAFVAVNPNQSQSSGAYARIE